MRSLHAVEYYRRLQLGVFKGYTNRNACDPHFVSNFILAINIVERV